MTRIPITENQLQTAIIEAAHLHHWLVFHGRPALRADGTSYTATQGDAGYLDLTLARNGEIMVRELKTARGIVSGKQSRWLRQLGDHGAVWTDRDWADGTILRELRDGPAARHHPTTAIRRPTQ